MEDLQPSRGRRARETPGASYDMSSFRVASLSDRGVTDSHSDDARGGSRSHRTSTSRSHTTSARTGWWFGLPTSPRARSHDRVADPTPTPHKAGPHRVGKHECGDDGVDPASASRQRQRRRHVLRAARGTEGSTVQATWTRSRAGAVGHALGGAVGVLDRDALALVDALARLLCCRGCGRRVTGRSHHVEAAGLWSPRAALGSRR